MESHQQPTPTSAADAQNLLHGLDADRAELARRINPPAWLYPAIGAVAALYVASPAIEADQQQRTVTYVALVVFIVLSGVYQRTSGVKFKGVSLTGAALIVALALGIILLLSTSFGLAAADLRWWIVAPAAAAFTGVTWLGNVFNRHYRDEVRRGR